MTSGSLAQRFSLGIIVMSSGTERLGLPRSTAAGTSPSVSRKRGGDEPKVAPTKQGRVSCR